MIKYRIDEETGALIFQPREDDKIKELEERIDEKDKLVDSLLKRIERLEKRLNDE